jgi:hypothetical protein
VTERKDSATGAVTAVLDRPGCSKLKLGPTEPYRDVASDAEVVDVRLPVTLMETMMTLNRFGYCCMIAAANFLTLPVEGDCQESPLRDRLVGVWIPTAHETTFQEGLKRQQFGASPRGMMILDASGNYTQILVHPDLPSYRSNDRTKGTPEEHAATVRGSVANFGTWSVDEVAKTLTYHIRGSTFPNQAGTEMSSSVSIGSDGWTGTIAQTTSGRQSVVVWKRAK